MINQCVLEKHVTWPTVAKGLLVDLKRPALLEFLWSPSLAPIMLRKLLCHIEKACYTSLTQCAWVTYDESRLEVARHKSQKNLSKPKHGTRHTMYYSFYKEGLNGVNRQSSNGKKINRQPSKTEYFYRQPSNERAKISRQISEISLNDQDRFT